MATVPATTAMVPTMVVPVTRSLPRRKINEIAKLKSGVVATIGETITTLAPVRATRVSNAPTASQNPETEKYKTPLRFQTSP